MNETWEFLEECYKIGREIYFFYKDLNYFLGYEDGDAIVFKGRYGRDIVSRCKYSKGLDELIIDGKPLKEVLKLSIIEEVF